MEWSHGNICGGVCELLLLGVGGCLRKSRSLVHTQHIFTRSDQRKQLTVTFHCCPLSFLHLPPLDFLIPPHLSLGFPALSFLKHSATVQLCVFPSYLQWCRLFWGRRCREFYSDLLNRDSWSLLRLKSRRMENIFSVFQVNNFLNVESHLYELNLYPWM